MKDLNTYFTLIFIIFAVILFILLILNFIKQQKVLKALVVNKFSLTALVESDVKTNKTTFSILVKNKSMNDASLSSLGITLGLKHFDFIEVYKKQANVASGSVVINPRAFIKLSLSVSEVEKLIKENLIKGKNDIDGDCSGKIEKIGVYVTDCSGTTVTQTASSIYKVIKTDKKAEKLGEAQQSNFTSDLSAFSGIAEAEKVIETAVTDEKTENAESEEIK